MNVLIVGGTGVISRAIVSELLVLGHQVTVFNRGHRGEVLPPEVERIVGDKQETVEFARLMGGRTFDAVIDMISYNVSDATTTVETFCHRTEHLIVCSTVAAYRRPFRMLPICEDREELLTEPTFAYAFHKAEMERYLLSEDVLHRLPVTIIRPSLTYGIGCANVGVLRQNVGIVDRIRKGKPLVMFGDGTTPWNFTFTEDLAKAFAGAVCNPETYGKAYHATNSDLHYWADLYLEFGRIVGKEPNIIHLPTELLNAADPSLFGHITDEKQFPSIFDNSKIQSDVPSFQPRISLREGLEGLVDWYERDRHVVDPGKDALEDALVDLYRSAMAQASSMSAPPDHHAKSPRSL